MAWGPLGKQLPEPMMIPHITDAYMAQPASIIYLVS